MSNALTELLDLKQHEPSMGRLAAYCHLDGATAKEAFGVASPIAVKAIREAAVSEPSMDRLVTAARTLTWAERNDPREVFPELEAWVSSDAVEAAFAGDPASGVSQLVGKVGLSEQAAEKVLDVVSWVAMAVLVGGSDQKVSAASLAAVLGVQKSAAPADPVVSRPVQPVADRNVGQQPVHVAEPEPAAGGGPKLRLAFVGVAAALLLGGGAYAMSSGMFDRSGSETDTMVGEASTEASITSDAMEDNGPAEPGTDTADGTDDASTQTAMAFDDEADDIVRMVVPMSDPTGAHPEASGVLAFSFNTVTGEVCYQIESENIQGPYRSHIHVGGAGVKGGIVVDLGPQQSGAVGCVDNLPVDTNAVLADRAGHYAELHDLSEDWTIRGQLSEAAAEGEIVEIAVPMSDPTGAHPEASGVLAFSFNTVTGEVCYQIESENIQGPYRSHIHVGGAGVKGGIVVDLGPQQSGAVGCVDNLPVDTNAVLADRAGHYAELHDLSEDWTIRGQLSEAAAEDEIVEIAVPMSDPTGAHPEASGVLAFSFNTVTGEVCYQIESENIQGPYRSHIHVGGAGVKGGIVVDLGPQQSGAVGCVDNLPVDTNAVLADRAGHYAELHDLSEDWTIRGQLSEATGQTVEESAVVDTDGGGARTVLDGGTIYLEGDVADQATADELVASLSGVGPATPVVNNLRIVPGAPLPSGRVVIADAIFFATGSDVVKQISPQTLSAISGLALSRPNWILTVVGHTDSVGSDVFNLELSLRRANALRDLLAAQGVPDQNLRIRGAGETAPVGDNSTAEGRAQNRRIEFEFTPAG